MMLLFNARERTEEEWKELFRRASPQLVLQSIETLKGQLPIIYHGSWTQ